MGVRISSDTLKMTNGTGWRRTETEKPIPYRHSSGAPTLGPGVDGQPSKSSPSCSSPPRTCCHHPCILGLEVHHLGVIAISIAICTQTQIFLYWWRKVLGTDNTLVLVPVYLQFVLHSSDQMSKSRWDRQFEP